MVERRGTPGSVFPEIKDPRQEDMNNFHFYMPGGPYSLDPDTPKNYQPTSWFQECLEKYSEFLKAPEEEWPEEQFEDIKDFVRRYRYSEAAREFLNKNKVFKRLWDEARKDKNPHHNDFARENVMRPTYIHVRQFFEEEDLTR